MVTIFLDGPQSQLGKSIYQQKLNTAFYDAMFGAPVYQYYGIQYDKFPDGSDHITIEKFDKRKFVNSRVFFFMTMQNNNEIIQSWHVLATLLQSHIYELTIVCPFMPCATMERVEKEGVVATANTTALLFSGLPDCGRPIRFLTYDIHTLQNRFFARNSLLFDCESLFEHYVDHLLHLFDVFVFPDDGAKKRFAPLLQKHAKKKIKINYCNKVRANDERVVVMQEDFPVVGQRVVVIDDIIRTGNTLLKTCEQIQHKNAQKVAAFCIHAPTSRECLERLAQTFDELIITDSVAPGRLRFPDTMNIKTIPIKSVVQKDIERLAFEFLPIPRIALLSSTQSDTTESESLVKVEHDTIYSSVREVIEKRCFDLKRFSFVKSDTHPKEDLVAQTHHSVRRMRQTNNTNNNNIELYISVEQKRSSSSFVPDPNKSKDIQCEEIQIKIEQPETDVTDETLAKSEGETEARIVNQQQTEQTEQTESSSSNLHSMVVHTETRTSRKVTKTVAHETLLTATMASIMQELF